MLIKTYQENNMQKLKDKYTTISEVAKELKVTRQTASRWLSTGEIKTEQVGREKLIDKKSLERFLRKKVEKIVGKYTTFIDYTNRII